MYGQEHTTDNGTTSLAFSEFRFDKKAWLQWSRLVRGVKAWRQLTAMRGDEVYGQEERFWVVFQDKAIQNPRKIGPLNLVLL
jgi:hypothetical protein